jgi:hypothetical protein
MSMLVGKHMDMLTEACCPPVPVMRRVFRESPFGVCWPTRAQVVKKTRGATKDVNSNDEINIDKNVQEK